MDNPQKFSNSKEVIAYLVETFPKCFTLAGDAKPLKIGIFQELSERLKDDERVSKTLLRSSLRHYTNSWRYLHSVKEGAFRIDLEGQNDAEIEKEHADHALLQLNESKANAAEKRKEQKAKQAAEKKSYNNNTINAGKPPAKGTKLHKPKPNKVPPPEKLSEADMVVGTKVTVKIGKSPMPATITECSKDDFFVQLDSGMVVKVQGDKLRLARPKR